LIECKLCRAIIRIVIVLLTYISSDHCIFNFCPQARETEKLGRRSFESEVGVPDTTHKNAGWGAARFGFKISVQGRSERRGLEEHRSRCKNDGSI
jgi:hypothetical protein